MQKMAIAVQIYVYLSYVLAAAFPLLASWPVKKFDCHLDMWPAGQNHHDKVVTFDPAEQLLRLGG
jgi:hypothetical protein